MVETAHYLTALLQHGFLVLTGRYRSGLEEGDVGSLGDGISKETHGNALASKATHLNLRLHGGVALQSAHADQVHEIEGEFGQFGNLALDKERYLLGIKSTGKVVEGHLDDILAHLLRIVDIVRECLGIGDEDIHLVIVALILKFHTTTQRTHIMTDMQTAGRAVARQDDSFFCFHICFFVWINYT